MTRMTLNPIFSMSHDNMITFLLVFVAFLLFGILFWKLHNRLESIIERHGALFLKVKEGENVIIENFGLVEKRFTKLEHEIKEVRNTTEKKDVKTSTRIR